MRKFAQLFLLLAPLLWLPLTATATHNRAGEITYTHISGTTYEVMITTYTKGSVLADRPWLTLLWGDEGPGVAADSLERESISILPDLSLDVQINVYRGQHTYAGPGAFTLVMEDPNRNEGVLNIASSVDLPFCITSQLIIHPQAGHNNSVQLLSPALENACLGQLWEHNPAAYDPDGDILTYALIPCAGYQCTPIEGYLFPDEVDPGPDLFEVDPSNGTILWDVPGVAGEYNIALRIREWRVVESDTLLVGEVIRDMQIDVQVCPNRPPQLLVPMDTCARVGLPLSFQVTATDPDGDDISLEALGGLFSAVFPAANFADAGNGTGVFSWIPGCSAVRREPWQAVFRAEDDPPSVPLVDIETMNIRVVVPPVAGLQAEVAGNAVLIDWNPVTCAGWFTPVMASLGAYEVWRRVDSLVASPEVCQLGMPDWGYTLVGSVEGLNNTGYVDAALHAFGATYCYRIVARLPDDALSPVSGEVCATIAKDVPVLTTASVVTTGSAGEIELAWSPPTDADTVDVFPGPYHYVLLYATGAGSTSGVSGGAGQVIWTGPMSDALFQADTLFTHVPVETQLTGGAYAVEAYSGEDLIGRAVPATTPWLQAIPHDNRIDLNVVMDVPWSVDTFYFQRQELGEDWALAAVTTVPQWSDTGRVNGVEACYRVEVRGDYEAPGVLSPIINFSQRLCAAAWDVDPPCAPVFSLVADCELQTLQLAWSATSSGCADDDVVGFRLWHGEFWGDSLVPIADLNFGPSDTLFTYNAEGEVGQISGCFSVTALDSLMEGPGGTVVRNESALSDTLCADNCPFYFLPNIFTPNLDGVNDLFEPFPYKFVDSVDFRAYNRWGELVYISRDPEIGWNGTHMKSGKVCADGVYFYSITVFSRRLFGVDSSSFSGEIQLKGGLQPGSE